MAGTGGGVLLPDRSSFPKRDCILFFAGVTTCSAGRVEASWSSVDGGFGGFLSRKMERDAILLIGLNAVLADLGESDMVASGDILSFYCVKAQEGDSMSSLTPLLRDILRGDIQRGAPDVRPSAADYCLSQQCNAIRR